MSEKLLTPTQLFTLKDPGKDLNTCPPGIYKLNASDTIKNSPTNGYGILISAGDSNSSMITQIFFGVSGGENKKIYWRNKVLSVWGGWSSY